MNMSGINVPITLGAGNLARRIQKRGWNQVDVGNQHAGDVAVAERDVHIFLVVKTVGPDEMIIADNQAPSPHYRKASGDASLNHSPVAYFLRAEGAAVLLPAREVQVEKIAPNSKLFPQGDEATDKLREPLDDNGAPAK
jgi:hypothetical protein